MDIQLTRLPGYDVNGNPRYVCHYSNLLTEQEKQTDNPYVRSRGMTAHYIIAVYRAHKIGGRKYHTRSYGGGIVFTDYENVIKKAIQRIVEEAEKGA